MGQPHDDCGLNRHIIVVSMYTVDNRALFRKSQNWAPAVIRTVLGYGTREMSVVHLCKVYCLSALMYGCESGHLQNKEHSRISVAWNNCFRSIFNCAGENPLQYFCKVLPINYLIHRRKLLYWNKLFTSDNSVLFSLSRLASQRFVAFGCLYGLSSTHVSRQTIKQAVWDTFSSTVE